MSKKLWLSLVGIGVISSGFIVSDVAAEGREGATEVQVNFVRDGDPGDPDGALRFEQVIEDFSFGEQSISSSSQTYTVTDGIERFVEVTDNRGTGAGWDVQVRAPQLASENAELTGAELLLTPSSISSDSSNVSNPPSLSGTIRVTDAAQSIISAGVNEGLGTWETNFLPTNLELVVPPGTARVDDYSTTITWMLLSTP
ncbi:WxL domain-containing protein [Geomicrobium sp. JCM 19038]|uniref:WxL domain-containing protein n=1 Tax=Geomicrobium sp. JCM 19038 TaxID=1460635 RepID=UPI00045F3AA0|nr:WxL domain-containing protein [Geomicrobium sp. JCM 19038]GAK09253.1 extracellular protein [Geomicrobium sp. JCM 19038]